MGTDGRRDAAGPKFDWHGNQAGTAARSGFGKAASILIVIRDVVNLPSKEVRHGPHAATAPAAVRLSQPDGRRPIRVHSNVDHVSMSRSSALSATLLAFDATGAEPKIKIMSISKAPEPVPALGNRLLPLESELTPGDAAPIYLRLAAGVTTDAWSKLESNSKAWLELPFDQFPAKEARTFLDGWRGKLAQLEFGAHRETCSWNYSLLEEREHIVDLELADAQSMRTWSKLLALQARAEISERHFARAARAIQTGMSFSRHVGDGPFFINALIGTASARFMLDQVDDLISQPGAPSLYWSLTALPRPLIGIRKSMAQEYKICERLLPEMTDLEQPRSDAEWAARLARFHARIIKIRAGYTVRDKSRHDAGGEGEFRENLAEFKVWALPKAKAYLEARQDKVVARNDDEMILKYFGGSYRDLYDDIHKAGYLAFFEAEPVYRRGEQQLISAKNGPLRFFAEMISNVRGVHRADAMLDRKVAMLRVVEALRLHAGVAGRLPDSLDQVKVVPIPIDPFTGKPFHYEATGESAELVSEIPGSPVFGFTYRFTLRK